MGHIPDEKQNGKAAGGTKRPASPSASANLNEEVVVAPTAPDGGWGWAVVFASFMVHLLTDGVTYSYGLFQKEYVKQFEASQQAASWVASLLVGVTYCSGPLSSFLVNKFGCPAVTVMGTILASGCLFATVYAKSLVVVYLTAGIGTGLGFGLIYLPAIVSVSVYFEKYRALATGIAVCGSGLGTVVFAPLISALLAAFENYRSAMLVLSGIILNCIIFGLMFKPLKPSKVAECVPLQECKVNGLTSLAPPTPNADRKLDRSASMNSPRSKPKHLANGNAGVQPDLQQQQQLQQQHQQDQLELHSSNNNVRLALSQPILADRPPSAEPSPFQRSSVYGSGIMNRSDVFLRSSINSIRKRSGSLSRSEENVRLRASLRSLPNGAGGHRVIPDVIDELESAESEQESNIAKRMLKFTLLRDPVFLIFMFSNFCTSIGYNVPYVFIEKLAEQHGMMSQAPMLLLIIGVANTFGRVVLGYVSDNPRVNRLLIYNICLTTCGIATAMSPFCVNFYLMAIYAAIFGFTTGAYVGLTSVCLVDLVGLDKLTNAFGLVLLSQGIASLAGPPIAGFLIDLYIIADIAFYVAGFMVAISGSMLYVIPPLQRRAEAKQAQHKVEIDTIV
ncbi:monocarboxylate transporter 7-like [Trichogramma pretiosum]|uniref:monocarboxylate transporter 7-like n=1 Tax=Trichogramma pretiosum TaxID=7493 RepID=UPI0006C96A73|nr:monocarboxylate transporter 7-like [Trichogramma pretiosum]XP_014235375.1 monocarboxylate transporter 7-like [Trichogramma pretiosum]XP_023316581.1 monocarboxylate transporter 7-like [Trichogramma pretiosum]